MFNVFQNIRVEAARTETNAGQFRYSVKFIDEGEVVKEEFVIDTCENLADCLSVAERMVRDANAEAKAPHPLKFKRCFTLLDLKCDPRVADVFSESPEDGWWLWLKEGWKTPGHPTSGAGGECDRVASFRGTVKELCKTLHTVTRSK